LLLSSFKINAMDKLSLNTADEFTLRFLDNQEVRVPKESKPSIRKYFLTLISECSVHLINFHERRQKKYQSFLGDLHQKIGQGSPNHQKKSKATISISKEIVEAVLLRLNAFEQNKGFLNNKVSLTSLSKSLQTNSSYLSKIINHSKGKTFKNYLNDLRVAYAHELMSTDPSQRKYTIEALAIDFGFKSAENFSKKFKAAYGMYPSKFMKGLQMGI